MTASFTFNIPDFVRLQQRVSSKLYRTATLYASLSDNSKYCKLIVKVPEDLVRDDEGWLTVPTLELGFEVELGEEEEVEGGWVEVVVGKKVLERCDLVASDG